MQYTNMPTPENLDEVIANISFDRLAEIDSYTDEQASNLRFCCIHAGATRDPAEAAKQQSREEKVLQNGLQLIRKRKKHVD